MCRLYTVITLSIGTPYLLTIHVLNFEKVQSTCNLLRARETEESKSVQHIFAPKTEIAEPIFGNFRNGRLFPFGIIFQFQNTGC